MTKLPLFSFITCFALLLNSCKKEEKNNYIRARYLSEYCPKTGAALVTIIGDPEPDSQIALLNLPQNFLVKDKVLLITYHYDESLDKLDEGNVCPAIFGPLKIFVCDSATEPTL